MMRSSSLLFLVSPTDGGDKVILMNAMMPSPKSSPEPRKSCVNELRSRNPQVAKYRTTSTTPTSQPSTSRVKLQEAPGSTISPSSSPKMDTFVENTAQDEDVSFCSTPSLDTPSSQPSTSRMKLQETSGSTISPSSSPKTDTLEKDTAQDEDVPFCSTSSLDCLIKYREKRNYCPVCRFHCFLFNKKNVVNWTEGEYSCPGCRKGEQRKTCVNELRSMNPQVVKYQTTTTTSASQPSTSRMKLQETPGSTISPSSSPKTDTFEKDNEEDTAQDENVSFYSTQSLDTEIHNDQRKSTHGYNICKTCMIKWPKKIDSCPICALLLPGNIFQ